MLVDEARDLIERTPSLAHVVVDEAQDLSPMECRAIGRRCATGSATVLGDIAQGTTPWATASWPQLLAHLGKEDAGLRVLDTGYRVPRQILDFASRLLDHIAPGLTPARSLRQDAGSLVITAATEQTLPGALAAACADALTRPGSAAVIAADDQVSGAVRRPGPGRPGARRPRRRQPRASRSPWCRSPWPRAWNSTRSSSSSRPGSRCGEARGLHRLYVALTRAVSSLTVLHAEPLPADLSGPSRSG